MPLLLMFDTSNFNLKNRIDQSNVSIIYTVVPHTVPDQREREGEHESESQKEIRDFNSQLFR